MADTTTQGTSAWGRTLDAATEMAAELRADGWETVTVRAGHVAPEPPSHGDTDRFGFVYLAPGEAADPLESAVERGRFERYRVFSRRVGSDLYALTRVTDPDRRLAVLLVGAVDLANAGPLATAARERGEMHSHVQLLDGTRVATFAHDDPDAFLPEGV